MNLNKNLVNEILTNNDLSLAVAKALGIQQASVIKSAHRHSSRLLHIDAIGVYKKFGLKEDQYLTPKKISNDESLNKVLEKS